MAGQTVRIGGASGYWGDATLATAQLLGAGGLDFIVYDYLAEITMGILARMRAKDPASGFAADFVSAAMGPNLAEIARQGVRIVSNAGGVNPEACAAALRAEIARQGLTLRVAVVLGDDLMPRVAQIAAQGPREMFSGAAFPAIPQIASVNAYLGAFPIAAALDRGADIVITGRCVDSAVTLGACISALGWGADELDRLAGGSLAGHIIECGTQATGGNFTDWEAVGDFDRIGYPIVAVNGDGSFVVSKPEGTRGLVSRGTVGEQMVYEIGDPQNYVLPDVVCDFSEVVLVEEAGGVRVSGALGRGVPTQYKTCLTYQDGFRGGHLFGFYGVDADRKAQAYADAVLKRAGRILRAMNAPEFTETSVEILGAEAQFGAAARDFGPREVNVKIAVKHADARAVGVFIKEATGLGLSAPPGLSGFAGARPKPSPVMALFSYLTPKREVMARVVDDDGLMDVLVPLGDAIAPAKAHDVPLAATVGKMVGEMVLVPLIDLAWARSGDKGNSANIGVIARQARFLPWIWAALDAARIARVFGHFLEGDASDVTRYLMPGSNAMNILMNRVLGGGGAASLRNDPQGKGYSQVLLAEMIEMPVALLEG
jgi:hypothetical protein